jgi:hypothetical protein
MVGTQSRTNGDPNTPWWMRPINLLAGGDSRSLEKATRGTKLERTGRTIDDPAIVKSLNYDMLNNLVNQARRSNQPVPQHALDALEQKRINR